jgi:hypothetical protein
MKRPFEDYVDSYLEGTLSHEETLQFERALVVPENAEVFREILLLRELLQGLPPDQCPDELVARIERELNLEFKGGKARKERRLRAPDLPRLRAVLWGAGWTVRGPAMAMAPSAAAAAGTQQVTSGLGTMRYALGPLATRTSTPDPDKPSATERVAKRVKQTLWRRATAWLR